MVRKRQRQLKTTALYDWHRVHGAKMVEYGGWLMPSRYRTGPGEEHRAVRTSAGISDLSHLGLIVVRGRRSEQFLSYCLSGDVTGMKEFEARFHLILNPRGGIIDGVYLYRLPEYWFLSTNPAASETVLLWLQENNSPFGIEAVDATTAFSLVALSGPRSAGLLSELGMKPPKPRTVADFSLGELRGKVSRTGYTGEDGFEFLIPRIDSLPLWERLIEGGNRHKIPVVPIGLQARETLRFEAGFPAYGKEMNTFVTPMEAGLRSVCDFSKEFIGKNALVRQLAEGPAVRLATIEMLRRSRPSHDAVITDEHGGRIGQAVSSIRSPWTGKCYCNAFIETPLAQPGSQVKVKTGILRRPGLVVERPLYKGFNMHTKR
jgi:glycine cleavage system T protein